MGYDVHITRANDWCDSELSAITLQEWVQLVASDSTMRLDGYAEATTPNGETLRYENEGLAVWLGHSRHEKDGNMAWFDYRHGMIVVKNPDKEMLIKMHCLAAALGAKVQGDDGEYYDHKGFMIKNNPNRASPANGYGAKQAIQSWLKNLFKK